MTRTLPTLKYYKCREGAGVPRFATENAACFDLCACLMSGERVKFYSMNNREMTTVVTKSGTVHLEPGDRFLIPTGLIFDIPNDHSIRLHIRSSMAFKHGLQLANGEAVIDDDYFHETYILLLNASENSVEIKHGDRIAQGELIPKFHYDFEEVSEAPTQKTDRVGGFGSTGKE